MDVNFNAAPIVSHNIGDTLLQSKSGTISQGKRFINESRDINFKTGKVKQITGVLEKQGNYFSDIYSNIFRRHSTIGSQFAKVEKLAKNGNATKTFLFGGLRRLKMSYNAGKLSGITLYNSKGLKLGGKLLRALF